MLQVTDLYEKMGFLFCFPNLCATILCWDVVISLFESNFDEYIFIILERLGLVNFL